MTIPNVSCEHRGWRRLADGGRLQRGLSRVVDGSGDARQAGGEDARRRTGKRLDGDGRSVAIWMHLTCTTALWSAGEPRVTDGPPPIDNGNGLCPMHIGP